MGEYTYKCYDCEYIFNTEQSIKDKPLIKCPNCKHLSLERLISAPIFFVRSDAKTIGQLADRNSKKIGQSEISERECKKKEENKKELNEARKELNQKLGKLNEQQKQRYIENG